MSVPPHQFSRIAESVDVPLLATKLVVVVGVGTVGSQIACELAKSGVGRLRLIDGKDLESHNLPRHALPSHFLGHNKAEALAVYLKGCSKTLRVEAQPRYINDSLSDRQLDRVLADADLIVAATEVRDVQRRLGRRALSLDIYALFPALYAAAGAGEVFVQRDARSPCFFCWDGFRTNEDELRAVTAINVEGWAIISLAVQLGLGVLDPRSRHADLLVAPPNQWRPRQLFVHQPLAALSIGPVEHRPTCPSCAVGPPPRQTWTPPRGAPPPPSQPPPRQPPPRRQSSRRRRRRRIHPSWIRTHMLVVAILTTAVAIARPELLAGVGHLLALMGIGLAVIVAHIIALVVFLIWVDSA